MKKNAGAAIIVILGLIIWLSSFWLTRSRAIDQWQAQNPVWMQDVSGELAREEQTFSEWIKNASQQLKDQQMQLGQLLDNPATSDQAILEQADVIAQTHAEILHTLAEHLATLRAELPEEQRQLLTDFCLQTLQGPMRRRYQHGLENSETEPPHQFGGNGFGYGLRQRRRQGRCGLTQKLQLTEDQIAIAEQKDPTFETDIRQLQDRLLDERQRLLDMLESQNNPNDRITQQIDAIIAAHNTLEKRLIGYIITMRQYFTPEQQKRLIGLCRKNCANAPCRQQSLD